MKQILGKLFLILFLTINSFAGVTASVTSPTIYRGDNVNFIISADGNSIDFPQISDIAGYSIIGTSSSQSVNIINGDMTRTISKTYSFKPDKSITIPSFEIAVDGKKYKTKELKVTVVKPNASQNGDPFVVEMKLNKTEAFVGEAIDLSVSFKRKLNAKIDKLQLGEPKLEDFWVKKVDKQEQSSQNDYIIETVHYQIFPQKSGEYKIPPIEALIGKTTRQRRGGFFDDPFFSSFAQELTWKKIYSNELNIKVNPLPDGLELYGKYQIQARVDKQKVHANKPVNLTIEIQGEGNIDDVKKFTPTIDNTIIYADEPKIKSRLVGGVYQGDFSQKIAIIADQNFTIPPMELKYFDKKSNKTKSIQTKPIDIEVIGGDKGLTNPSSIEVSPTQTIQTPIAQKTITVKEDGYIKYLFLLLGFILGLLVSYGVYKLQTKVTQKESDIVRLIRKAKQDKELFEVLLPYAKKDKIIANTLNKLEENIYRNGQNKINKEEVMEIFEEEYLL
jgi:hypothetical protein